MLQSRKLAAQEELIDQVQHLLGNSLNLGEIELAIALGNLLNDLANSYKLLSESDNQKPVFKPGKFIGLGNFKNQGYQRSVAFPPEPYDSGEYNYSKYQYKPEPPKPTTYNWADGFKGVELPPPSHQELQQDYWENQ